MLKKLIFRKVMIASLALFTLSLYYILPAKDLELEDIEQRLEYVDKEIVTHDIFLLDSNNYLALTKIPVDGKDIESLARELIQVLIIGGEGESKIPSGFRSIIANDTKINSIKYDNGILKINLSKEFIESNSEYEEKIIESIVFTLTSIEGVDKIIIYKDGEILSKLPSSEKILPSTFDRRYGINKRYIIDSLKDIVGVTVYYINEYNGNYHYVPVTNYLNDTRDPISIIIEQLSSEFIYVDDLMSFMSNEVELVNSEIKDDMMILEFNNAIFNDFTEKQILEEVIYTIFLSVEDNYDVEEVMFLVENEEIYKKTLNN